MKKFDYSNQIFNPHELYRSHGRPDSHSRERDYSCERHGGSHSRPDFPSRDRDGARGGHGGSHSRPDFPSRDRDGARGGHGGSHSRPYFPSCKQDGSRGGHGGPHSRPDFPSRKQDGARGGHGGPHSRPDFHSREQDGAPNFDLRDAIGGSAQKPQCYSDGPLYSLLQLIVSMMYSSFISGCQSVSFNDILQRLEEKTPTAFNDVREFLLINQKRLEDALKNVGLIQLPDMSWSAPSGLPPVEEFIPMVIRAFSNSIYRFWNAKKYLHDGRPAFQTDSGETITACGVLFYSGMHGFLMQLVPNKKRDTILSDFGGKVDAKDNSPFQTLTREIQEETNGKLPHYDVESSTIGVCYIPESKYILFICQAPQSFDDMDLLSFGSSEEHSSIPRTVSWVSVSNFIKSKTPLHPRLVISQIVRRTVSSLFGH
jgi:hypothetical protein